MKIKNFNIAGAAIILSLFTVGCGEKENSGDYTDIFEGKKYSDSKNVEESEYTEEPEDEPELEISEESSFIEVTEARTIEAEIVVNVEESKTEAQTTPPQELQAELVVKSDWKELYSQKLMELVGTDQYETFDLVYIDDDEIPELVISAGSYHYANCQIYTVKDNKLIQITESIGVYGTIGYIELKSIVIVYDVHMGYTSIYVSKINDNNQLEPVKQAVDNRYAVSDEKDIYYKIDGKDVTKNEYDNAFTEYNNDPAYKGTEYKFNISENSIKNVFNSDNPVKYEETMRKGIVITKEDDLNVRSGPSTDFDKIGTVPKGGTVNILYKTADWYAIDFNGKTGYVRADYIRLD